MSQRHRTPALLCLALLPLFAAPIAHAKDDHWTFEVAAGAGVTPRYSGSKDFQASPMVSFDALSPGGWFLGTTAAAATRTPPSAVPTSCAAWVISVAVPWSAFRLVIRWERPC
ncbi:hypothetical protein G6F63_016058 [Rhizopus arrhizus]|nr:hypothetical protein G6F63_016058 [Rhizopus arrhizus]